MKRCALLLLAACAGTPPGPPPPVGLADPSAFPAPSLLGIASPSVRPRPPLSFCAGDTAVYGLRLETGDDVERWLVKLDVVSPPGDGEERQIFTVGGRDVAVTMHPVGVRATVHDGDGRVLQSSTSFVGDAFLATGSLAACDLAIARRWRTGTAAPDVSDEDASLMIRGAIGVFTLFGVLRTNEALAPILHRVVRRPSLFSVIASGGVELGLEMRVEEGVAVDGAPFDAARAVRYPVRITANGSPALEAAVFAVTPMPPSHLSAGIVAIDAWHPDDPSLRFRMRLLAGQRPSPLGD